MHIFINSGGNTWIIKKEKEKEKIVKHASEGSFYWVKNKDALRSLCAFLRNWRKLGWVVQYTDSDSDSKFLHNNSPRRVYIEKKRWGIWFQKGTNNINLALAWIQTIFSFLAKQTRAELRKSTKWNGKREIQGQAHRAPPVLHPRTDEYVF